MTIIALKRVARNVPADTPIQTPDSTSTLLLASEVAARLRVTEKALEHWRRRGMGPNFIRLGRNCIRYRLEDIEIFIQRRAISY